MAEVVLFHHVQGLTSGMREFADALRDARHKVHTPDLFEQQTFDSIEDGMAYVRELGFERIIERGVRAVDMLPTQLVYAGFSLGALPAQKLAETRAGAIGALLFHACVPFDEFAPEWPASVPVQVHAMDADPEFVDSGDMDAARELVGAARQGELLLYPGNGHLFTDSSVSDYDATATKAVLDRVLPFLANLGDSASDAR